MTDFVKREDASTGDFRSDNKFLLGYFEEKDHALLYRYDAERVIVEPWGKNSLRVRASKMPEMPDELWALDGKPEGREEARIVIHDFSAEIVNGNIKAVVNNIGKITFYNQKGEVLLEEYVRNREDMFADTCSSLEVEAREFKPIIGGDYQLTMRFESNPNEKIYGMGQYQQKFLNVKGAELELAHRNSQASVPFALSSLGYGFLWNNPAIGRVSFNKNITSWEARSTKKLDYWITAGDTPAEIEEAYADATGKVPMMPEYGMGFWQCKLRYQTQEELLEVAREYKRRQIPIDVIVVDFFHWPKQGDWRFDETYWPDPDAMIAELKEMGIELMVSIWPMVDYKSENFEEMKAKGLLTRVEKGVRIDNTYMGNTIQYDPTHPEAREYVWNKAKQNYYDKGVKIFWLDEAEPEYTVYDFENYRYHLGPNVQIGNVYPAMYAQTFFEGMKKEGQENIVNLLRCACPVMRLHGYRMPYQPQYGTTGGAECVSGAPNEIWSYGDKVYEICKKYIEMREAMRPYVRRLMEEAHEKGTPVMRPMFYDFPEDKACWDNETQYMFGPEILVAPVMEKGETQKEVYLPTGAVWKNVWTGETYEGGQTVTVPTPIEQIPLFTKNDFELNF